MLDSTRTALSTAAIEKARKLCTGAFETLRTGRRTFVKGKVVMVPFAPEKREELRRLQLGHFEEGPMVGIDAVVAVLVEPLIAAEGITPETADAFLADAVSVYRTVGINEVNRLFNEERPTVLTIEQASKH